MRSVNAAAVALLAIVAQASNAQVTMPPAANRPILSGTRPRENEGDPSGCAELVNSGQNAAILQLQSQVAAQADLIKKLTNRLNVLETSNDVDHNGLAKLRVDFAGHSHHAMFETQELGKTKIKWNLTTLPAQYCHDRVNPPGEAMHYECTAPQ